MKWCGAVLMLLAACGGAAEPPRLPFAPAPLADPARVTLGARRHPDEEPNAAEDRAVVVRQAPQARPGCACGRK